MDWIQFSYLVADQFPVLAFLTLGASVFWGVYRYNKQSLEAKKKLEKAVDNNVAEPISLHPKINPEKCAGCGACVRACPEGEIIRIMNHRAVLVTPSKCVGHGECQAACPFGAITLVFGTETKGVDIPTTTSNYETNITGIYIAGELGGMGLIRNAFKQGKIAAQHACSTLNQNDEKAEYDLLIVGAGPAGLAASLAAKEKGVKYLCVEKDAFGGSIANFPRQKLIMTHPTELPLVGKIQFPYNKISKNQIIQQWNDIRNTAQLNIAEHQEFLGIHPEDGIFKIQLSSGEVSAKKVILATGARGSPKKLGVANESLPKVTYHLMEPEQYQKNYVAVVGAGNVAIETTLMLCKKQLANTVSLIVRSAAFDRCNEQNQDAILEMEKLHRVHIWYEANVLEIHPDYIIISQKNSRIKIINQFLFVCIGTEIQNQFLQTLGIKVERKFEEPLPNSV